MHKAKHQMWKAEAAAERAAQPTSAMTLFPQTLFLKLPLLLNSAYQAMCAFSADLDFRLLARHTEKPRLTLPWVPSLYSVQESLKVLDCLFPAQQGRPDLGRLRELTFPPEQNPLSVLFENQHRIRARPVKVHPPSLVFFFFFFYEH